MWDDDGPSARPGLIQLLDGPLEELPEDDFRHVIDALLRNELDPGTRETLTRPPLLARTRATLEGMAKSVGSQLEARAADIETLQSERHDGEGLSDDQMRRFELDYARWKASALRFRGHLREVLAGLPSTRGAELEAAIRTHRQAIEDDGDPADHALWAWVD